MKNVRITFLRQKSGHEIETKAQSNKYKDILVAVLTQMFYIRTNVSEYQLYLVTPRRIVELLALEVLEILR